MKHPQSKTIRHRQTGDTFREHSTPIFMTSSFTFENAEHGRALFAEETDGNIYTRFSNPNITEFVDKMTMLENCEDGVAFASGMAAVFGGFAGLLQSGDHVVSSRSLFGSSHQILTRILPRWGISCTYVDADRPQDWEAAIQPNTRMIFVETPSNPGLDIIDLQLVHDLKKEHNLILMVDNTFATPVLQSPSEFDADLICHSATKYIDGQGRTIGGVICGTKELVKEIRFFARQTGPSLSPFNAWLLSKSLETLHIRMQHHTRNAQQLAEKLDGHGELESVRYPFLKSHPQSELARRQMKAGGGIVTFTVKGGFERAKRFIDRVGMASKTANLGDTRTIVTHPASTTHSKLSDAERLQVGISGGLVRISVGLEHFDDILADIEQALERSK